MALRMLISSLALIGAMTQAQTSGSGTANSNLITDVQNTLRNRGYNVNTTGLVDPMTTDALKAFQARNGIAQTGALDPATLRALNIRRPTPSTE